MANDFGACCVEANGVWWMLPDLSVLQHDGDDAGRRLQTLNDGWTLKIINVSDDDLGLYQCLLRATTNDHSHWLVLRLG